MSPKETAELEKKPAARKTAEKKEAAKKTTAKKSPAKKAVKADKTEGAKAVPKKAPAKKAPAKKPAAKKAAVSKEAKAAKAIDQSPKEAQAVMNALAEGAALGAEIQRETSEILDAPYQDIAIAILASRTELAKKSAAENNAQKNLAARSKAAAKAAAKGYKKPARKKAKKNAVGQSKAAAAKDTKVIANEIKAGAKIYRGIEEVPGMDYAEVVAAAMTDAANAARAELAAKSFNENNAQKNLSARSEAAKQAFILEQSHQSEKALDQGLATVAAETMDGEKYLEEVAAVKGAPYEKAPKASKAKPAKKVSAKEAFIQEGSHQSEKAMDEGIATIAAEYKDGLTYLEEVAKVKGTPYEDVTNPSKEAVAKAKEAEILAGSHQSKEALAQGLATEAAETMDGEKYLEEVAAVKGAPYEAIDEAVAASRAELAKKSAAENNAQKNLSARSKAAAKAAAKGFKKPTRKKAKKNAADQTKAVQNKIVSDIEAEIKAGANIMKMIPEVPGTPYEKTLKEVEDKAAMESRKVLASRTRPAFGAANSAASQEETDFYNTLDNQTLIEMAQALGLDMDYDTLKKELELSPDIDVQTQKYLKEIEKSGAKYSFGKDGFSKNVVPFLTARIAATLPNKAADNVALARKISKDIDRMLINDSANDTAIYNDLFDDVKKVLMYAQHNNLHSLEEVEQAIPTDLSKLVDRFMTVAYTILPGWQYNDVKYYEGFLYSVMAQFDDLATWQNRALMDIADLYIKHGDYQKGNDGYGYVLRENDLKDQIYYRFAKVYEPFDLQRAKGIAGDALKIIDGRYTYYPQILEILNR